MKLPPYIQETQKKDAAALFHMVRQTQGIEQALLMRKLMLVAAYGEMIWGKITFYEFIQKLKKHIAKGEKINTFWGLSSYSRVNTEEIFRIPCRIIVYENQNALEEEIQFVYKTKLRIREIRQQYVEDYLKMFKPLNQ